jgi:hypothetical protein
MLQQSNCYNNDASKLQKGYFGVEECPRILANGVNPFREIMSIYSVWPIFFFNKNIPPWMSIKREHIMLTMIVPGICLH